MRDWQAVLAIHPWGVGANQRNALCEVQPNFTGTPQFTAVFPNLHRLLSSARRTRVHLKDGPFILFAWGEVGSDLCAWLSPEGRIGSDVSVCNDHRILFDSFGGIEERYNEPEDNWLLNHNEAWLAFIAKFDASFIHDYDRLFDKVGGIPIDTSEFYQVACEANGNCVFCSRTSGKIIAFAPHGSYEGLVPLEGCPGDTLYTFEQASDFKSWVECIAVQWIARVG